VGVLESVGECGVWIVWRGGCGRVLVLGSVGEWWVGSRENSERRSRRRRRVVSEVIYIYPQCIGRGSVVEPRARRLGREECDGGEWGVVGWWGVWYVWVVWGEVSGDVK
jgi:hypothetical protein